MTVAYIIFSIVGWAWLVVVGLYMGWRIYRQRREGVVAATPHKQHEQQC
ncbi:MAG: hypothetical protein IT447_04390 [Phycisphaerales bacterium]|jgi:hypothetical protein|nr:hypothetical protein [Phycisphaerales bacterium]